LCQGGQNKESEVGGVCGTRGEKNNLYGVVVRKSEGKSNFEDLDIDDRIILKWMAKKRDERV
jgi:hypothetical protein